VLLPSSLAGHTLSESGISSRTGLSVIGIQQDGRIVTNPPSSTRLQEGSDLLMLGSTRQRQAFTETFR
ncbi:MAG: cation:proton antiporter regulatory subunit, partial [Candidatus Binatia bacterium]